MTDRYTITELVMTKGTSAPVRVALLEMEKKIIALEAENERLREVLVAVDAAIVDKKNPFDRRDCISEQEQAALLIISAALGEMEWRS
jgi:hypothetical protein